MSAICGGIINWSDFKRLRKDELMDTMMCLIRRRVNVGGHYRYKIIDPLGERWWWEDD